MSSHSFQDPLSKESLSAREAANRLLNAFRTELDSYVQHFLDDPVVPSRVPAVGNGVPSTGVRKRVVLEEPSSTPAASAKSFNFASNNKREEEEEPLPVHTPYYERATSATPAQIRPRTTSNNNNINSSASLNAQDQQQQHQQAVSLSAAWKNSMNEIADIIEDSEARVATLQQENSRLVEKVDVLTRDYAMLQEDFRQMQIRKVQSLEEENDSLRQYVEELRSSFVEETKELRDLLREVRAEREVVERDNHRLLGRIRDYEHRNGMNGSPTRQRGHPPPPPPTEDRYSNSVGNRSYARARSSPGEALVRELSEKTSLDAEYLAPLSDILDRRLGRTTTGRTPSRNLYN